MTTPKRVLVTGGAGFIGSHIIDELLRSGHEPAALDDLSSGSEANLPSGVPLYRVDIRDPAATLAAFQDFRPDWVSHQAAQMSVSRSVREPGFDASVNIMGLISVLDAAVAVKAQRVVFASSGGVLYGDVAEPADEDHPANPVSPYGISKWVGEAYLWFYHREYGLTGAALRYSNVYGPRQNPHGEAGVVAIFCTRMFRGESTTINGDGRYDRDYVFVEDVARANVAALSRDLAEPVRSFNIGTAVKTDVNVLADKIHARCQAEFQRRGLAASVPAPGNGPARPGDLRSNVISPGRASKELEWRPQVDLESGLDRTVRWFADREFKKP
jgi:UDP-glucose 4-epimerase